MSYWLSFFFLVWVIKKIIVLGSAGAQILLSDNSSVPSLITYIREHRVVETAWTLESELDLNLASEDLCTLTPLNKTFLTVNWEIVYTLQHQRRAHLKNQLLLVTSKTLFFTPGPA